MRRPSDQPQVHVAIVGVTGVGKSTLVNVLKGEVVATVNNNVRPCTTKATRYELVHGGTRYNIWDTRGLNEGSDQATITTRVLKFVGMTPNADRDLKKFLRGNNPSIDLVLLCIDARKIRVNVHWKMYNKIYEDFCERRINVGVVVMGLGEGDLRSSAWKGTCQVAAQGVVEEFPDGRLMEGVPKFEELGDSNEAECKRRILTLISNACSRERIRA